jgi:hypothetical protein
MRFYVSVFDDAEIEQPLTFTPANLAHAIA